MQLYVNHLSSTYKPNKKLAQDHISKVNLLKWLDLNTFERSSQGFVRLSFKIQNFHFNEWFQYDKR